MRLNDLKIGARLAVLVGVLLMGNIVTGAVALTSLRAGTEQVEGSQAIAEKQALALDFARAAQVHFKIQIQEWKNTLLRGGNPQAFEKYSHAFHAEGSETRARLQSLRSAMHELNQPVTPVDELVAALQTLENRYDQALTHFDAADADASARDVDARVKGQDRAPTEALDKIAASLKESAKNARAQALNLVQAQARATWIIVAISVVASIGLGVALSWAILRSITVPLRDAVQSVTEVAHGRLTSASHVEGQDEVAELLRALSRMSTSLSQVVHQVRASAQAVSMASGEIESGNHELSSRTESQASNVQQTAATIEQLASGVRQSSDSAQQAHRLASEAAEVAQQGGSVVNQVVQTMEDINTSSRKIADIIGVIDGIAFQTNILALNAAVEAARAGEQGRGFAVVAAEVRALAQRCANAAREVKSLINASVTCVERGSELVGEAGQTITSAMDAVIRVRDVISEITDASREQATGVSQVSQSIGEMDGTMQQNAALVEQVAASATSLRQQAASLQASVDFFHV